MVSEEEVEPEVSVVTIEVAWPAVVVTVAVGTGWPAVVVTGALGPG